MLRYLTCTITMYVMVVALARLPAFVMRILTCFYVLQLGGRPHFYLALIGVIPEAQGMGYGAELMRYTLKKADELDLECYLESSKESNVPFYQKNGFVVWREWRANEHAPVVWLMHRPKKSDAAATAAAGAAGAATTSTTTTGDSSSTTLAATSPATASTSTDEMRGE